MPSNIKIISRPCQHIQNDNSKFYYCLAIDYGLKGERIVLQSSEREYPGNEEMLKILREKLGALVDF
jgi:hypothetical protein